MTTLKTIQVPGYRKEYDLFWGLFFRGQVTHEGWSLSLVGNSLPAVIFPEADEIGLRWETGGVILREEVVSLRVDRVGRSDERVKKLTSTGTVDRFRTAMGQFVLNFGTGDARPRMQRTEDSIRVDWPNAVPRVDVPWWPFDPAISHVDAKANRVVNINTTSGLTVKLEFT